MDKAISVKSRKIWQVWS